MAAIQSAHQTDQKQIAPYGSWKSPITTDLILSEFIGLNLAILDGDDTYWLEGRPSEGGRNVIVRRSADGTITDMTPATFNVRTRVHEYGGGDFTVSDGVLYFSNFSDQRLYRQLPGSAPVPLTPIANMRYADFVVDQVRQCLICVCEDHTNTSSEAVNMLVSLPLDGSDAMRVLAAGNDFYASPRLSPDGQHLAWLSWDHPNMPWDGCELWVAQLDDSGYIDSAERIAGGSAESIFQPQWSPDGLLYFVSDRTGWWNLYRMRAGDVETLIQMEAEFGRPQWQFNMSTYAFTSAEHMVCWYTDARGGHLANLDTTTGSLSSFALPYTSVSEVRANQRYIVLIASSPLSAKDLIQINLQDSNIEVIRRAKTLFVDQSYISVAQPIEFPTEHGLMAYANYYAPQHPAYVAPAGELPPLLTISHGGPTSAALSALSMDVQYWTSRGFAVLDVNYGGSSGYGRAYRERLRGQWGVVDVDDCVNGARYLVQQGLADEKRLAIRGGSAGGYTTLCALTFRDLFSAGASHFGVGDLILFQDTHKFESRYLDGLVGPYPEMRDLLYQRSAINFTDQLSCPVIFFQGLDDKIVPPNQAESMVAALRAKHVPVAYLAFEGEQHGFRQAENIKRSLEAELYFYAQVFKFDLAEPIEPVTIENL